MGHFRCVIMMDHFGGREILLGAHGKKIDDGSTVVLEMKV